MAKNLKPPENLCLQGNLKENFRKFKQQFQIYMTASGLTEKWTWIIFKFQYLNKPVKYPEKNGTHTEIQTPR